MSSYPVRLVAPSGREQAVLLKVRRDGIWLFTEQGKEIQQLPYQHIVKWLPSIMRTKDPGSDDCLDIQVETASGKKDLRMRCVSVAAVGIIISDIRATVQAIMSELDPQKAQQSSPLKAGLAATAAAAAATKSNATNSSPSRALLHTGNQPAAAPLLPSSAAPPPPPPPQQQQQQQQQEQLQQQQLLPAPDAGQGVHQQVQLHAPEAGLSRLEEQQPEQQSKQQLELQSKQQQHQAAMLQPPPTHHQGQQQQIRHATKAVQEEQLQHSHPQQHLSSPMQQQAPILRSSLHCGDAASAAVAEVTDQQGLAASVAAQIKAAGQGLPAGASGSYSPSRYSYQGRSSPAHSLPLVSAGATVHHGLFENKEMELQPPQQHEAGVSARPAVDAVRLGLVGSPAPNRRLSAGALLPDQEAAAQIQFLEELVKRLSEELALHLGSGIPGGTTASGAATAAGATGSGSGMVQDSMVDVPLPPWMSDSRYLNPLLSAYDHRLTASKAELAAKSAAVQDIEKQVGELVAENDSLYDRLTAMAARLEGHSADAVAAVAATDTDKARLHERLELLEQENDLLVGQQVELDDEILRLAAELKDKEHEVSRAQEAAAAATALAAQLEAALRDSSHAATSSKSLKARVKELTDKLDAESARAAAAVAAAEAAKQRMSALQTELAAAQATVSVVPRLQVNLSKAHEAVDAAQADTAAARSEAEGLRVALRAVEGRLQEYQQKDTEVYLRIKQAMELAEEARLERDAARATTDSLAAQLEGAQMKLREATRQLTGGGAEGGLSWHELRKKLAVSEGGLSAARQQLEQRDSQVVELSLSVQRLTRDKASLTSELGKLREELCLCSGGVHSPVATGGGALALSERLYEAERARDDALLKLDRHKRAADRAERGWQLEQQKLQADVQHLQRRADAADAAAATATRSAAEAQQTAAAAEAELGRLKVAHSKAEAGLQQQLLGLRQQRDTEVAALAHKLERALAACSTSIADAERMLSAKDQLLGRWKQEAQLIASKFEVALQQHQAELADQQEQVKDLTHQLAAAVQQQEILQQEVDAMRVSCQEADVLLAEAHSRAAAAGTAAAAQQEDLLQELRHLQGQLERSQLDKLRAERLRDGLTAKLERLLGSHTGSLHSSYDVASPHAAAAAAATDAAVCEQQGFGLSGKSGVVASPLSKVAAAVLGIEAAEELGQQRDQQQQPQQQVEDAVAAEEGFVHATQQQQRHPQQS